MSTPPILIATRNPGKLAEMLPLLAHAGMHAIDLGTAGLEERTEEADLECFETFEENARAKARYFHERSGGMVTIAEDSGLEVAALGGRPGVHTKRWSGRTDLHGPELDEANNAALLAALVGVADRSARYVCAAVYMDARQTRTYRGETAGRILLSSQGHGGFGYDPLFESTELGMAFGEASVEAKSRVSHRARALRALVADLRGAR